MSKKRMKIKKTLAFMLSMVLLVVSFPLVAKADDFDYKTSEFSLTIDDITYNHHSDGTCDIMNKDGTINKTMTASETEHKFAQLDLRVDEYGSWYVYRNKIVDFALGGICGALGAVATYSQLECFQDMSDSLYEDLKGVTYSYMTDQDVTLDSDQLSDIYDKLNEMLRQQKGLVEVGGYFYSWQHSDAIYALNKNLGGSSYMSSYYSNAIEYLKEKGCTAFYMNSPLYSKDYWYLYGFDTSDLAYHDSYYSAVTWLDDECNQLPDAYCYYVNFDLYKSNGWVLDDTCTGTTAYGAPGSPRFAIHIAGSDVYYLYKSFNAAYSDITGGLGIYTTTNFDNGDLPTSITLSPTDLEINWDDLMDELSTELDKQTSGITDKMEKQEKIDETISKYLKDVKKDVASIEDNTKDMSKDIDSILTYLKKMYKRMDDFYDDMTKDALKGIQKSLDTLNSSIKSIGKDVSTIKTLTEVDTLIDTLNTLIDDDGGSGGSVSVLTTLSTEVSATLEVAKGKFPFSVPWDVYYVLASLAAEPEAPVFDMVLDLPQFNIHEEFTADLSIFSEVSSVCRGLQSLLFVLYLASLTRKMFLDGRKWF